MTTRKTAASDSPEVRERAVRLVLKGGGEHPTQLPPFGPSKAALPFPAGPCPSGSRPCQTFGVVAHLPESGHSTLRHF